MTATATTIRVIEFGIIRAAKYECPRTAQTAGGVATRREGRIAMKSSHTPPEPPTNPSGRHRLRPDEVEYMRLARAAGLSHAEIAQALHRSEAAIRNAFYERGWTNPKHVSLETQALIVEHYQQAGGGRLDMQELSTQLGVSIATIQRTARQAGLTDAKRHKDPTDAEREALRYRALRLMQERGFTFKGQTHTPEMRQAISDRMRSWFANHPEERQRQSERAKARIARNGHPRGALGLKHSEATRKILQEKSRSFWDTATPEQKRASRRKAIMTNIELYGTAGPGVRSSNAYSRTRSGKRDDLGGLFVRSAWEANYARYLNWLVEQGEIEGWEYEADTFIFHGVTRGAYSYTPDFKVTNRGGSVEYHEVKGWMDGKSKTRLKRMTKFYPDVKVIVIGEDEYKSLARWKGLIPEWE